MRLHLLTDEQRDWLFERESCKTSLGYFVQKGWHVLHPRGRLVWSQMHDVMAAHWQAWWEGLIPRFLDTQPPGTAKSLFASIYGMAWAWTWDPTMRAICLSANPTVALVGANRMHDLVASEWYQRTFRPAWQFSKRQDTKGYFENTSGGGRFSQSTRSLLTGQRAPRILADDLLDAREVLAGRNMDRVQAEWERYATIVSTRTTLGEQVAEGMIAQRLAECDPPGMALAQGGWDHLCLPAEYPGETRAPTSLGWVDWRQTKGEVLDPRLLTPDVLRNARLNLTEIGYQCQYNQVPSPAGGAILHQEWLRYWGGQDGAPCPGMLTDALRMFQAPDARQWDAIVISVDGTWKDTKHSDYAVAQVWGVLHRSGERALRVLLAQFRHRCLPSKMVETVRGFVAEWAGTSRYRHVLVVIEAKASGPNVADQLRADLPHVQDWQVQGTQKSERLISVASDFEEALVLIPSLDVLPWARAYKAELLTFPQSTHDDQVDATAQALRYIDEEVDGGHGWSARAPSPAATA